MKKGKLLLNFKSPPPKSKNKGIRNLNVDVINQIKLNSVTKRYYKMVLKVQTRTTTIYIKNTRA